jgi:hypothetical protein
MIKIGSFSFEKSKNVWFYKAEDPKKLDPKYHDLPRFNAQLDLEKVFKKDLYKKVLQSTKEISKLLT